MSLSSILQRVQNKGKLPVKQGNESNQNTSQNIEIGTGARPQREVDPVVARLKELRKQENEKKLQLAREKKGLPPIKPKQQKAPKQPQSQNTQSQPRGRQKVPPPPPPPTAQKPIAKKLKFNDLMKKASKIDQSSLSINLRQKTQSPEASTKAKPVKPSVKPGHSAQPRVATQRKPIESRKPSDKGNNAHNNSASSKSKAPIPIRKPSSMLQQKLKVKKPAQNSRPSHSYDADDYESEEELDGFVVSDEEETSHQEPDYDRDEIWAMFNKGKKRSHYDYDDYDSDDMEATGAEILDEEYKSRRTAEIEDRREAIEEARRAALKEAKRRRK